MQRVARFGGRPFPFRTSEPFVWLVRSLFGAASIRRVAFEAVQTLQQALAAFQLNSECSPRLCEIEEGLAHLSRGGVFSHLLASQSVLTTFLGIAGHGSLLGSQAGAQLSNSLSHRCL